MLKNESFGSRHRLITGPSHSARLRNCIRTGQIGSFGFDVTGVGGMPIWSPRLAPYRQSFDEVVHIVGDFRFGNSVLELAKNGNEISEFEREFLGIDRSKISKNNDKIMYEYSLNFIQNMISEGRNEKFLFWDLTIREYLSRKGGNYSVYGIYQHPTWNLSQVIDKFREKVISTEDILENANPLFLDSSAHPTFVGWHYIIAKVIGSPHRPDQIIQKFYATLSEMFSNLKKRTKFKKVFLCGNSVFTRILEGYLRQGSVILPDWIRLDLSLSEMIDDPEILYIFFPPIFSQDTVKDEISKIKNKREYVLISKAKYASSALILFDHWAKDKVSNRPDFAQKNDGKIVPYHFFELEMELCDEQALRLSNVISYGSMLELGSAMQPSLLGIVKILVEAISSCSSIESAKYYELVRTRMSHFVRAG